MYDNDMENVFDHKGEFFRVLTGTDLSQTAVMTIPPGGDSGPEELHSGDQIVYIIEGKARVKIGEDAFPMRAGDVAVVPKETRHHIRNDGDTPLFFFTVYAPPQY